MEAIRLRTSRATEPTVKGVEGKLRILVKEDV